MSELKQLYDESSAVFLSKGRNRGIVTEALREAGVDVPDFTERQIAARADGRIWMLTHDKDMGTCLEGRPDGLGFMGTDTLGEFGDERPDGMLFTHIADLKARFALLTTEEKTPRLERKIETCEPLKIATTYTHSARLAIGGLVQRVSGARAEINFMNVHGSTEGTAVVFDDVDGIFDLVESGDTARANGVHIIYHSSRRLSVGAVALRPEAVLPDTSLAKHGELVGSEL